MYKILTAVPFASLSIVEDCQLGIAVQNGGSHIGQKVGHGSNFHPRLLGIGKDICGRRLPVGLGLSILGPIRRSKLSSNVDKFNHIILFNGVIRVGELLELSSKFWIVNDLSLFIKISYGREIV